MKIAILDTNTDRSVFAQKHPTSGEMVKSMLANIRPDWVMDIYVVSDGIFPDVPLAYDGYVLTGSPASVNDPADWITKLNSLVRLLDINLMPMIGLCFGHQAIVTALGGVVEKTGIWGLGATTTEFYNQQTWMTPPHKSLRIYCAHEEQVTKVPEDMTVIARDQHCPVSACLKGDHIMTCQHHPEMPDYFIAELLNHLGDLVSPDVIKEGKESLETSAQGNVFAQWMVNFLEIPR